MKLKCGNISPLRRLLKCGKLQNRENTNVETLLVLCSDICMNSVRTNARCFDDGSFSYYWLLLLTFLELARLAPTAHLYWLAKIPSKKLTASKPFSRESYCQPLRKRICTSIMSTSPGTSAPSSNLGGVPEDKALHDEAPRTFVDKTSYSGVAILEEVCNRSKGANHIGRRQEQILACTTAGNHS